MARGHNEENHKDFYSWLQNFNLELEYLHWKVVKDSMGLEKAHEISLRVWRILTISSWRRAQQQLNLKAIGNFADFKKVVKYSIPKTIAWQIHKDTSRQLIIWYMKCPWHDFVHNKLNGADRISYADWLIEAQKQNCLLRIRESGLHNVSAQATTFMCAGDRYCELVYRTCNPRRRK